jgi:hypothetical protein
MFVSSRRADTSGRVNSWRRPYLSRIPGENFGHFRKKSPGITAKRCVKCNGETIQKKRPLGKKKIS